MNNSVLNIAHRCGGGLWPENTIYALRNSMAMGVDAVEIDIQQTRDGHFVVIHDLTVDRTSNGRGRVVDMTLKEIKSLDAGYRFTKDKGQSFPYRNKGITIPTLEEILMTSMNTSLIIIVEIKAWNKNTAQRIVELISSFGMESKVIINSAYTSIVKQIYHLNKSLGIGLPPYEVIKMKIYGGLGLGCKFDTYGRTLQIPIRFRGIRILSNNLLKLAKQKEIQTYIWTINDKETIEWLIRTGVDGIITDYPNLLL
jgi:glycerophosphoryl diester phosphodiesterase